MFHFHRIYTALITPFDHRGGVDEEGLRYLIRRQIENGIEGVLPLGSTGESPTLTGEEQKRIIRISREETREKAQLLVGTGTNSTAHTIENTLMAEELGADCALIVTPYYNKPTQEGLYQHYKAIAQAVEIPIIIYNVPYRTGQNLQTVTLKRLLDIPTIVGVKEASGNISQISDVIELTKKERPEFCVLSGDDALTLPLMAMGGHGVISVASNLVPDLMKSLVEALASGNLIEAQGLHYHLAPLLRALFVETNPIPIKAAMGLCGLPSGSCRLPLCSLSSENILMLEGVVKNYLEISTPVLKS